jgi:hypothetical protein
MNGVMIHDNREILPTPRGGGGGRAATPASVSASAGQNVARTAPAAAGRGPAIPPGQDQPIGLMGHPSAVPGNAVRYRNIWVRRVNPELPTQTAQIQNP